MDKALIVSGGKSPGRALLNKYSDRFIIAADSGVKSILENNLKPDLFLGDMDSVDEIVLKQISETSVEILKYPPKKDFTDTNLAINVAVERNFKDIVILGALGTRFDHALANSYSLIDLFNKGIKAHIEDENCEIYYCETGEYEFIKSDKKYLSVISISEKSSYTTKGLFYEVDGLVIERSAAGRGVSNSFLEDIAKVKINHGKVFVILSKD